MLVKPCIERSGALGIYIIQLLSSYAWAGRRQFGVDMDTPFENLKKERAGFSHSMDLGTQFRHYVNDLVGCVTIDIPFERGCD